MFETARLKVIPLNYEQQVKFISGNNLLEEELELPHSTRETPEELLEPIQQFVLPNLKDSTKNFLYYTTWIAIERSIQKIVGSFRFKGPPNGNKEVEIGYGVFPEFQNRGLMTELLSGAVEWCMQQEDIEFILGATDHMNLPSMKVLQKNSFQQYDFQPPMIWWRRKLKG